MRVLVAGGAGFIGSHFVKRLQRAGDDVVVLDVPTHGVTIRDVLAGVDPEGARRLLAEIDRERLAPSLLRKLDPSTDVRPFDAD